jgi:hypothetical protein
MRCPLIQYQQRLLISASYGDVPPSCACKKSTNRVFSSRQVQISGMIPTRQQPACTAYHRARSGGSACYEEFQVGLTVVTFFTLWLSEKQFRIM